MSELELIEEAQKCFPRGDYPKAEFCYDKEENCVIVSCGQGNLVYKVFYRQGDSIDTIAIYEV